MAQQSWTLIDSERNIYLDAFETSTSLVSERKNDIFPVRVSKRRLHGGLSEGVDLVELDNGCLSLSVLPTRGMSIWRGRCGDVDLKWNSPNSGPVHPHYVPVLDPGGLGWLEGFDEWLVRCGLENNGSPEFDDKGILKYPLHGRIGNLPAQELTLSMDDRTGEIILAGKVLETKLFFKKLALETALITTPGSSSFVVRDTVTNLSAEPGEFELLYHINTGLPFASPGSRLVMPFDRMAPRGSSAVENLPVWNILDPETPGSAEAVFFFAPAADQEGNCTSMLVAPEGNRALAITFQPASLPYFSFWKCRMSDADGYVCGLEPAVNFPNNRSFEKEHGRVVQLAPGESRCHELKFQILNNVNAIAELEQKINRVTCSRTIHPSPIKEWTP